MDKKYSDLTSEELNEHFKECKCHDSYDQCPCAEGGHPKDGSCNCCPYGAGLCGSLPPAKRTIFSYSTLDEKVFAYNFREDQIQKVAEMFDLDIFFELTDEEAGEFLTGDDEAIHSNLKNDFIFYKPRTTGRCIVLCTCEKFLESDEPTDTGINRLAKKAVHHARKTGHTLNPRGN